MRYWEKMIRMKASPRRKNSISNSRLGILQVKERKLLECLSLILIYDLLLRVLSAFMFNSPKRNYFHAVSRK